MLECVCSKDLRLRVPVLNGSSEAKQSARICQAASHGNFPFEKRIESLGQAVKACQRILMDSQNIGGIRKMLHQLRFTPCLSWLS